jgi:glycosyltransferase involved in cell wall biosynthesis
MESFGMVLIRAFACAVPVVASDIPGYRDVMTDQTGTLVRPADPAALSDAIVASLEEEERRLRQGAAARELAADRYSWGAIAARLADIYEVTVRRAGRTAA